MTVLANYPACLKLTITTKDNTFSHQFIQMQQDFADYDIKKTIVFFL